MGGGTNPAPEPDAASATGPGLRAAPRSSPLGPLEAGLLSEGRVGLRSKQVTLGGCRKGFVTALSCSPRGLRAKLLTAHSRSFESNLWRLKFVNQQLLIHCPF